MKKAKSLAKTESILTKLYAFAAVLSL